MPRPWIVTLNKTEIGGFRSSAHSTSRQN